MIRNPDNVACFVPLGRATQNQHGFITFHRQSLGQETERFTRPMFGGTKRSPPD